MSTAKFSPSTSGIYPTAVYADFPSDALDIPDALYIQFKNGEISGFAVAAGAVVAYAPPAPTLAELKSIKITQLSADAQAAIYAGFESSALGSAHTYPAQNLDQQNLSASVLASLMPGLPAEWVTPFWCQDIATGVWDFRLHTAPQIQQAGQDGKSAILAALVKNKTLADQVVAAATAEQVEAVAW